MRLGQLARKLEIRTADIVAFLSRNNIQIEDGSNTRIEDDHTALVIKHFNPALLIEKIEIAEIVEEQPEINQVQPVAEEEISPENDNVEKELIPETSTPPLEQDPTEPIIEVIKASKAELPGLKVLGKIELPELKKKETTLVEEGSVESPAEPAIVNRPARQERRPARNNQPRREEQWKNPIALKREREAREAEEKRKAQLELEKEKRMVHYLKKVKKTDQPVKATRLENEETTKQVKSKVTEDTPKTWLGKIIHWFSTPTR